MTPCKVTATRCRAASILEILLRMYERMMHTNKLHMLHDMHTRYKRTASSAGAVLDSTELSSSSIAMTENAAAASCSVQASVG